MNLLIYVILYALINYFIGINIPRIKKNQTLYIFGIIFNIVQLALLQYVIFTFDPFFQFLNIGFDATLFSKWIEPLGVSFFTLQGIGYLMNVKIGWEKPEKNFIYFLLYIIFYPRFLSGPIDRSNQFLPQLRKFESFNETNVSSGLKLVLIGLFEKIAIANQLAPLIENTYTNIQGAGTDSYPLC